MWRRFGIIGLIVSVLGSVMALSAATAGAISNSTCTVSEVADGYSVRVDAGEPFGRASLNFRDSRWIATGDPVDSASTFDIRLNREPSVVIIRRSGERVDLPCTTGSGDTTPQFQCFAIDTGGGEFSASVVSTEPFGDASINYRDTRWILTDDPADDALFDNAPRSLSRLPTVAIVRINGNSVRFDVPCTDDLYDGVDVRQSDPFDPNDPRDPNRLEVNVAVQAVWDDNIVWGEQWFFGPTFRFPQINYISQDGQDSVRLTGGDDYQITSSEVLCDGRLLRFRAELTTDPGPANGVIDPDAAVMFIVSADSEIVADCEAGIVTATSPIGTEIYRFDN